MILHRCIERYYLEQLKIRSLFFQQHRDLYIITNIAIIIERHKVNQIYLMDNSAQSE